MSGTSSSQSQDEFADLPDIVDFSLIRPEDYADNSATHSLDEFAEYDLYNEHDPYADLDLNTVPGLGAPTPQTAEQDHARMQPESQNQGLPDPSSQYLYDELNEVASAESNNIEELNHIEMRDRAEPQSLASAVAPMPVATAVSNERLASRESSILSTGSYPSSSSMKRKYSDLDCNCTASVKVKRKARSSQDPHASARKLLSDMEDSVSCSICYEIYSEPHVSSPCGHTFCAECVVEWMKKNISNAPKCPLCRTALTQGSLVAPNFALKATIDKYVAALADCGLVDWQSQGKRYMEWVGRNARWLNLWPELRDLRRRRWNEVDEPSQDLHLVGASGLGSDGDSSDDDRTASDGIYWAPRLPRR